MTIHSDPILARALGGLLCFLDGLILLGFPVPPQLAEQFGGAAKGRSFWLAESGPIYGGPGSVTLDC